MPGTEQEVQDAIFELHDYLSDRRAPLMVADSVALLLEYPAEFLAAQIQGWVAGQVLTAPAADYLYHGARKIALMGEFDLVSRDGLAGYLRDLGKALLPHCPAADRELLRQNLERLDKVAATPAPVAVLHRPSGALVPPAPASPAGEQTLSREVRRLSLLLEHLRPLASAAGPVEQRTAVASQFMTAAAVQSSSTRELDQHLAPLRQLGIDTQMAEVFRTLARSLAGWTLPRVEGQPAPSVSAEQLQAMRRIVSLADDPAEVAKRFREMVHAAIEQFNEGHLGRAVNMFELAERLAAEEKIQPMFVQALRTQGHDYLDPERLRGFAERRDSRGQLRPILDFFSALQPIGLLDALDGEPRRERRHQILALIEVHEQAGRAAAYERLTASAVEDAEVDPFFQRNLVYLLRVIPRAEEVAVEDEVAAVLRVAGRSSPSPLVKEVIAFLSQSRHDKAERALVTYLKVFESMILQPETAAYRPDELDVLLDRTCAALARYGTPRAWRMLVEHGLKSDARLGSPYLRLAEAARADLSSIHELVDRIVAAIRAELPRGGMLGLVERRNEDKAVALIHGLAGTPLPEVRELLEEVAARYAGRNLGEAAAKALAALDRLGAPTPAAGLSGDLDLFGLPSLMQTIGQSQLSGVLSLITAEGKPQATLLFEQGRFRGGQSGNVRGDEAVYQLLERPFPGTFAFVSRTDVDSQPGVGAPQDVMSLMMEGVRRYDEFQRAAAVVADGARLTATGDPHTSPEDEDPDFTTLVWNQATSGRTPSECEAETSVDPYRVRRLVARWVEEGALRLEP
ncbi:MAG TPA: DUF4388 domain-containing protein [Vicinamibacteria bacterium]|nr:DUF4388 domain-containing protein [Vicinamibacteria bacterium]